MRLCHPNINALMKTLSACNISLRNKIYGLSFCKACQYGKQHRLSFKHSETKTSKALEIIHSDLWSPAPTESNQDFRYYIAFIDDKTSYTWIYGLTHKSQALTTFISFKNQIEKSLELKIKALQCDMGGKYKVFEPYLKHEGISLRYSYPYTHHQNGNVERKHNRLVEKDLTLLAQSGLPLKFWWEAFSNATYLINRTSTPILNEKTPFESLYSKKSDYSLTKIFGCENHPFLRPYNRYKFDFHTSTCINLGFSHFHKGYMSLNSNGRMYIAAHVNFNESSFPFKTDMKFMNSKQNQLSESLNSFSKFITVSFPSESHNHEATTTSSNSSENPILDVTPSDDQDSNNSHNQTTPVPNSVLNTHSKTQNTLNYSIAPENTEVQN